MLSSTLLIALGAAQLTTALTIETRQALAPDSPEEFELFAQYSMAAYCDRLHDGIDKTAVCTTTQEAACPNFEDTTTVREFVNADLFGIGGYIARNPGKKHIVVAFKGTDSAIDVMTDVAKAQIDSGCRLHQGFGSAFDGIKREVEQAVKAERATPGQESYRVVVTGHSLGGAVATIAGAYLRKQGIPCDLYTYGSPRVGNDKFAQFASTQAGFSARITNRNDVVTAIPMFAFFPRKYEHTFPEYWYPEGLQGQANRYDSPRRVCRNEGECTSASCGRLTNIFSVAERCNVSDHSLYMSSFKPCGGRESKELDQMPSIEQLQAVIDKQNQEGDQGVA